MVEGPAVERLIEELRQCAKFPIADKVLARS